MAEVKILIPGYAFRYVCEIKPEFLNKTTVKEYLPQSRYENKKKLSLNKYGRGPFCKFKIPSHYNFSGVYIILVEDKIKYIGECQDFSSRYNNGYGNISPKNCFKGGQETNCRLNNLIYETINEGSKIFLWFLKTDNYKKIEKELIILKNPVWNKV